MFGSGFCDCLPFTVPMMHGAFRFLTWCRDPRGYLGGGPFRVLTLGAFSVNAGVKMALGRFNQFCYFLQQLQEGNSILFAVTVGIRLFYIFALFQTMLVPLVITGIIAGWVVVAH